MQTKTLEIDSFLKQCKKQNGIFLDTRSTGEYTKAHIPGAFSLPLLDDEHRAIVGTIYKQKGREAAVLKGFELVGPLFHEKISKAIELAQGREIFVYCWRGGMRSNIMSWLLQMSGLKTTLLKGGYKSFRHWVLNQFEIPRKLVVLGGRTGSGKTEMLKNLQLVGEQVIDLESIANHRGSAFGHLGLGRQPSQEYFENMLAIALEQIDPNENLWLENESRTIGGIRLPNTIYDAIRSTTVVEMNVPLEVRQQRIWDEYGVFPTADLIDRTNQITRKLGGQHAKAGIEALEQGDHMTWLKILLVYYDKNYQHGNETKDAGKILPVSIDWTDPDVEVRKVLNALPGI